MQTTRPSASSSSTSELISNLFKSTSQFADYDIHPNEPSSVYEPAYAEAVARARNSEGRHLHPTTNAPSSSSSSSSPPSSSSSSSSSYKHSSYFAPSAYGIPVLSAPQASYTALFEDLGVLARGQHSELRRVKARVGGEVYAVKIVDVFGMDLENRRQFQNEATILQSIPPHPNIIRFHAAFFSSNIPSSASASAAGNKQIDSSTLLKNRNSNKNNNNNNSADDEFGGGVGGGGFDGNEPPSSLEELLQLSEYSASSMYGRDHTYGAISASGGASAGDAFEGVAGNQQLQQQQQESKQRPSSNGSFSTEDAVWSMRNEDYYDDGSISATNTNNNDNNNNNIASRTMMTRGSSSSSSSSSSSGGGESSGHGVLTHGDIYNDIDASSSLRSGAPLCVVMELADCGDLQGLLDRLRSHNTHLHEAVYWHLTNQVAEALAVLHTRRLIHRDIKPANVFLAERCSAAKLGDLGVGRYMSSRTMQTFSLVGTPFYMSPEAVTSTGHGLESDIWSLGCLFYELAALRSPFYEEGINFYSLGQKIKHADYPPLSEVVSNDALCLQIPDEELARLGAVHDSLPAGRGLYSDVLEKLIVSMLQVDPSRRPTAAQILEITRRCARAFAPVLPFALEAYFSSQDE